MSSPYPILDSRPIDKWRVTELKDELKRRKLTTKGLKEDLLKRLDEAIRTEVVPDGADNGSDVPPSELQSDQDREGSGTANDVIVVPQPKVLVEEGGTKPFVPIEAEASLDVGGVNVGRVDKIVLEDIRVNGGSLDEGKVAIDVANVANASPADVTVVEEPAVFVGLSEAPMISLNEQDLQYTDYHKENGGLKLQLDMDDLSKTQLGDATLKSSHADNDSIITSTPNMQVSEVSPVQVLEVKSDSIATDSKPTNENNELKSNIIVDEINIELDVKPEIIQPSPGPIVPDDGKSHPMDVAVPHENKSFIEENGAINTENVEKFKKNYSGDMGSPEKLNLDQSFGADSMEEDVSDSKPIESIPDKIGDRAEKVEACTVQEEVLADVVVNDIPAESEVATIENENSPATFAAKRKLHANQSAVGNNDVKKRQQRWNSEARSLPATESASTVDSTTPKDTFVPTLKGSFSKSATTASEEAPKERVVPQSLKPQTNSLRIDRFLRPFTLKAVQELLGKTGTVTSFWMDHIKTHCYISYSSVEEAIETRNAVYNLQWPTNGGHLLIAEFVDPQEVKARIDPSPQSFATPVSTHPTYLPAQPIGKHQLPTQRQVQRQQLPPPSPPPPSLPPPPLSNPFLARVQPPPAREQLLPPPPAIHEKVDPPIITLDDLFQKTKATPRIYYLPLSDEQVAAKLRD